jgi:transcriptional regulator with XRE-family HTH domain
MSASPADETIRAADFSTAPTRVAYGEPVWWLREKKEISDFLYRLLVSESPRGYARQVAQRMGIPYPTLSKYWLGKRRFPAALVKPLFLATDQDPRVAEFFLLGGSEYRLQRVADPQAVEDLSRAVMWLARLEARVNELYLEATTAGSEDGERLSRTEAEALRAATLDVIAHAEKLCGALDRSRKAD